MKRRLDPTEKKVEQLLKELPDLKDQRSKEEMYLNVKGKIETDKKMSLGPKWIVPAFSAAAALFLLLVLIPTSAPFMDQFSSQEEEIELGERHAAEDDEADVDRESQGQQETQEEVNISESSGRETETDQAGEEKVPEKPRIENEPSALPEETAPAVGNYMAAVHEDDIGEGETSITIPLQDEETSFVVPLSFVLEASKEPLELMEELIRGFSGDSYGLELSPLQNIDLEKHSDASPVKVHFEEEMSSASSAESESIMQGLEETFRFLEETEVSFTQNGENGVNLGNYGVIENYSFSADNRGYFVYTTEENMSFLVSGKAANVTNMNEEGELFSLKETLDKMKNYNEGENRHIAPPIPHEVIIDQVQEEGETARVIFSEDSRFPDEDLAEIMIEAVLFAAADFGYDRVSFDGEDVDQAVDYDLDTPIEVPVAPNYVAP